MYEFRFNTFNSSTGAHVLYAPSSNSEKFARKHELQNIM